jgi:PadR family transcriptional regulator PadR
LKGNTLYNSLKTNGFDDLSEGTLYPLLIRLEKNNLLSSVSRDSPLGPKRKYYFLTKIGEQEFLDFCNSWDKISKSVNKILGDDING